MIENLIKWMDSQDELNKKIAKWMTQAAKEIAELRNEINKLKSK